MSRLDIRFELDDLTIVSSKGIEKNSSMFSDVVRKVHYLEYIQKMEGAMSQ
jgi:hypothetical protein